MALFFDCNKWYSYCIATSNIQDFPILRFHVYTPTIFFSTNVLFLNVFKIFRNIFNDYILSTIIYKGCTWFSMVSMTMEERYEKKNTVLFLKKIKLAFEIGLPINETQFSKTTTKNDFFHISWCWYNINGNWYRQDRCIL